MQVELVCPTFRSQGSSAHDECSIPVLVVVCSWHQLINMHDSLICMNIIPHINRTRNLTHYFSCCCRFRSQRDKMLQIYCATTVVALLSLNVVLLTAEKGMYSHAWGCMWLINFESFWPSFKSKNHWSVLWYGVSGFDRYWVKGQFTPNRI